MTQGTRLRIVTIFTLVATLISITILVLAFRRTSTLESLRHQTDATSLSMYRLTNATYGMLYTAADIYEAHIEWERAFTESFEYLDGLAFHPGIDLLDPSVEQMVRQTRNLWNITTNGFVSGGGLLVDFLNDGIPHDQRSNISAILAAFDEFTDEESAEFRSRTFTLQRAYLEIGSANDQLWFFTTSALEGLSDEIAVESARVARITVVVATSLAVILVAAIFTVLFTSMSILRSENVSLEDHVRERTRSIQNLLDFSGAGFLTFGPSLIVGGEVSRECETIFGRSIAGEHLPETLYPANEEKRNDFADAMALVFSGSSDADVVFDLIETRLTVEGRTIQLDFRQVDETTVMCQLQDVTERELLQRTIEKDSERRELVLRAVTSKRYFLSLMEEATNLFDTLESTIIDGNYDAKGEEHDRVVRQLHTFKANAAFLRMKRTEALAHDLESTLIDHGILLEPEPVGSSVSDLRRAFNQETSYVTEALGDAWLTDAGTIEVNGATLRGLYDHVRDQHPSDVALLTAIDYISRLRLSALFGRLSEQASHLASSKGKRVSVTIDSEEILVTPDLYNRLSDALNHIIRNMVTHGVEFPRHREKAGKDGEGLIFIEAREESGIVTIKISDDGAGISVETVKAKAIERGLIREDAQPAGKDIVKLIFEPGFSTAQTVTAISGRGFGLSVVRDTIRRAGGKIGVSTRRGRGTEFTIQVANSEPERNAP